MSILIPSKAGRRLRVVKQRPLQAPSSVQNPGACLQHPPFTQANLSPMGHDQDPGLARETGTHRRTSRASEWLTGSTKQVFYA